MWRNLGATTCFGHFPRASSGLSYVLFEATLQHAILSVSYLTRSRFDR
jgi:hypothetical protein